MADRRGALIPLLIIAWIFLSPDPARIHPIQQDGGKPLIERAIAEEQRSLSVVQNSSWDPHLGTTSLLNLTGLEPARGYAWASLPTVKATAVKRLKYALGEWGSKALDGRQDQLDPTPLYRNVTGYVRGRWRRSKLQDSVTIPQLNLSDYASPGPFGQPGAPQPFDRNITTSGGDITLRINEKESAGLMSPGSSHRNVTELVTEMRITDGRYGDWTLEMHGVYFNDLGQGILATTSDKFGGIFLLPHLALSQHTFSSSRNVLNESITRTIRHQIDRKTESLNPWSAKVDGTQEKLTGSLECDLIVYLQQLTPLANVQYSSTFMGFVERELRFPTGAFVPNPPTMRFSLIAFSPDCGYLLESQGPPADFARDGDHLTGPKMEVQHQHSRQHLLVFTIALALQLFLLVRQMREASTPSTRSRISFYTVAMLALGDGFATMTFLLVSLFLSVLWVNLIATGFLAFISVSFFGMRFLMDIWHVQAPERERRARAEVEEERRREEALNAALDRIRAEREANRAQNAATNASAASHVDNIINNNSLSERPATELPQASMQTPTLPLPVTARPPIDTGAAPLFLPSDQAGLEPVAPQTTVNQGNTDAAVQARMPSFASLYTRFYLLLLVTLFLSLNAISWPLPIRRVYFTFLGAVYFSFWTPQILRNVQRNCRHALNWEFVLGQSVLRLLPFAYFYGYRDNVLFTDIDYYGLALLATWVWIQVLILASQELIGPRWFVKRDWAPPAYDYHPVLREDEEGAMFPVASSHFSSATDADPSSDSPPTPLLSPSPAPIGASVARESKERGKRVFDCAICMQELEVPVLEAAGSTHSSASGAAHDAASLAAGLLARRSYMVTPCRHIFHSPCLEGWTKYRLQCPICRETLPPL